MSDPRRRSATSLALLALVALSLSCTRLPEQADAERETRRSGAPGTVPVETLGDSLSVPADWGELIAVFPLEGYSGVRLWFQDEEGAVRIATFDQARSVLWPEALVIRRR